MNGRIGKKALIIAIPFMISTPVFLFVFETGGTSPPSSMTKSQFVPSYSSSVPAVTTINVGQDPSAIAYDPLNTYMYVANDGSNNVSVINSTTNSVVANISVGSEPMGGIAYDPSNTYMYVTNWESNTVSVINSTTNSVVYTINETSNPMGIAYDPSNTYMYVTNQGNPLNGVTVTVINSTTNSVVDAINVGTAPIAIAYDPSNTYMYVTNQMSNTVSVIDSTTNSVVDTINVGSDPQGITYDPLNTNMYVTNADSNNVSVINSTTNSVVGTINVGQSPLPVAYDPSNTYLYVTNAPDDGISVINSTTNSVVDTINVDQNQLINAVAYDPSNTYMYVANYGSTVSVFESIFCVTFTETGLPSGTTWYVNTSDGQSLKVTTNTASLYEVNGDYSYTISTSDKIYGPSPSSGTFTVKGTSVSRTVSFSELTYNVKFTESDLPSGTPWYVNISGQQSSGAITGTSYTVNLPNGTYSYSVSNPDSGDYTPSYNNSFTVNGTLVSNTISFWDVMFMEQGLPSGTTWYLNLSNGQSFAANTTSDITFSVVPNEVYNYTLATTDKNYAVNGTYEIWWGWGAEQVEPGWLDAPAVMGVVFSFSYPVTFTESALPSGTPWYVNISGQQSSGAITGTSYTVNLPNGTYSYNVTTSDNNYTPSYNSSFTVNGTSVSRTVSFSELTYNVTFTESDLPSGTPWYVNISGQQSSGAITGSSYTAYLPNGTYTYSISTTNKKYSAPGGTFTLNGTATSQSVKFSLMNYSVTLTETGLPSGTSWSVIFNGVKNTSTGTSMTFTVQNGTYLYTVNNLTKYYTEQYSGSASVKGKAISESITFTQYSYIDVIINPDNATLYINGFKETVPANGTLNMTETAGTYSVMVTEAGYQTFYDNFTLAAGHTQYVNATLNRTSTPSVGNSPNDGIYAIAGTIAAVAAIGIGLVVYTRRLKR